MLKLVLLVQLNEIILMVGKMLQNTKKIMARISPAIVFLLS